jgi:cold shock CspA family protein
VRWFDRLRGFGLIARGGHEADCFVQHAALRGTVHHALERGDAVEFDVVQGGAGAVARDVVRLGIGLTLVPLAAE